MPVEEITDGDTVTYYHHDAKGSTRLITDATGTVVDELPLSAGTRRNVRVWAARWEALTCQQMDADAVKDGMVDGPGTSVAPSQWDELDRDGRALWIALQQELPNDYELGWATFPDSGRHAQWDANAAPQPCPFPPQARSDGLADLGGEA